MAIVKNVLKQKISIFSDQLHYLFEGFPENIQENAEKWADALDSYINSPLSTITPPSTTALAAKAAMLSIMSGLEEPVVDDPSPIPFTLYYRSPEYRMRQFNLYLVNKINYVPNPTLDKTEVFTKLRVIREQYNRLYPMLEFTTDDIFYNQRRFNEIYANEITNGFVVPLKQDGYTTNTNNPRYQNIPVDATGRIIALQEDGIIGDDTIRYLPKIEGIIVTVLNSPRWNAVYRNIPVVVNPKLSGEVDSAMFPRNKSGDYVRQFITSGKLRREFIDTGKIKDYTKLLLDTTQNTIDGGLSGQFYPPDPLVRQPISYFIKEYERRHTKFDNFWIKNGITNLTSLQTFYKLKPKIYAEKPKSKKEGIKILEQGITAYATQLAIGMAPNFTGAPSPNPINLSNVNAAGLSGSDNSRCIELMVGLIDSYFKQGTAVNNSTGATIFWV